MGAIKDIYTSRKAVNTDTQRKVNAAILTYNYISNLQKIGYSEAEINAIKAALNATI